MNRVNARPSSVNWIGRGSAVKLTGWPTEARTHESEALVRLKAHDATGNGADVWIVFVVLDAGLGKEQPVCGRIGQKQIRPIPEPRLDTILQQPVDDIDGRTQHVALGPDRVSDSLASMEHHLQVKTGDDRTGRADVIARRSSLLAPRSKRPVHLIEAGEECITPAVQHCHIRGREDRVAFELGDFEVGLDALDHCIQQLAKDRKAGGDPCAEVDAVSALDVRHERRIPGDVGQQQVPITRR